MTGWKTESSPIGSRRTAHISGKPSGRLHFERASARTPHQFRTGNDSTERRQTRSNSNENAAKSTKLIDLPPLITVWLQVRVLPGPSRISVSCFVFVAVGAPTAPETAPDTCTFRSCASSRTANPLDGARRTWVVVNVIVAHSSVGDAPIEPLIKSLTIAEGYSTDWPARQPISQKSASSRVASLKIAISSASRAGVA